MNSPRPPFAWLGRHTAWIGIALVVALAAFYRFYQLWLLPPGLYTDEAIIGQQALALAHHGQLPSLAAMNGYAPLWVWLQATSVALLGPTTLALRLWPALLGVVATITCFLWLRAWFSYRIAWLAALIVAVTPWAVTLGRNAL